MTAIENPPEIASKS